MNLVIPYNLEKEEKKAVLSDDLVVNIVEPNTLPAYSPQKFYPEKIRAYRDLIFELLKGKSSLSILVDDHTRPTPARFAVPELLDIAEVSHIKDLRIIFAFGSHEFPPEEYLEEKVGEDVWADLPIILHNAYSRKEHKMIGHTSRGTPLLVNRWVLSADVKISLGSIFPSSLAGFTGGGKMILPGVTHRETIDYNHSMFNDSFLGKIDGNPMREDMEEAAKLAGLDLIIDSVLTSKGEVISLHIGDPVSAHREGVEISIKVYEKPVPRAGIVIIGCGSTDDIDFVHLLKALEVADNICTEGGVILLIGACTLGIMWDELIAALEEETTGEKQSSEQEVFAHLFIRRYSSIFLDRTKSVFWVSQPEHESIAKVLGFEFFGDLQSAVNEAISKKRTPSITVLPRGSLLSPLPF